MVANRLRGDTRGSERGVGMADAIAGVVILAIGLTMLTGSVGQTLQAQRASEHHAVAQSAQQGVIAQARQADWADLGFYADDPDYPTSAELDNNNQYPLPIQVRQDGSATTAAEDVVRLGDSRDPDSESTFDPPIVQTFNEGGYSYRVHTIVTHVPGDQPHVSHARRVLVTIESAPGNDVELTGECQDTTCSYQTLVRVAGAPDAFLDENGQVQGARETDTCNTPDSLICSTYLRQGRVLDGAHMSEGGENPLQIAPVTFTAHTSKPATAVSATYTLSRADGTEGTETIELAAANSQGTRWGAEIPADTGDPKGMVRPGPATATFHAAFAAGGNHTTDGADYRWSLDANRHLEENSITAQWAGNVHAGQTWCHPDGDGQPLTIDITGHSPGLRTGAGAPTHGADTVEFVFGTTASPGATPRSETAQAELLEATPVTVDISGTAMEIAAEGTWQVQAPGTADCASSRTAAVIVHRAIDDTTTTIPLTLDGAA